MNDRFVESRDGTRLDVKVFGQGPPMVLVHGASVDRRSWSRVTPRLAERFTVHALDRRRRRRARPSREVESVQAYEISDRLAKVDVPVRLLVGTESPRYLRPAAEAIAARLPRAELVTLTGQGHMAIEYAPRLFADQVFAAALDEQGGGASG
ncbi:alpha/beta fold hydrolase [Nonomuraea sp. NPDC050536]|uniref:alpha/beta fold hydrolase n=1 Tax=Nonomuraea sp. NPDC050536 TaxID=3364366 RepID=UPI0037C52745